MVGRSVAAASALSLLTLLVTALPVTADHRQPHYGTGAASDSDWIVFDHKAGNEWWVEVKVTQSYDYVSGVYARSETGSWQQLTLRSWGNWAASFHIPPGERVQFQAYRAGGMSDAWRQTSCYFTHPAGVEQCDAGSTGPFTATFRNPSGNAGWFQVFVDANRPVQGGYVVVDSVNGGTYVPLKKQGSGAWGASVKAPQGTVLRAIVSDGTTSVKSYPCWMWTTAASTDQCTPDYGPGQPGPWATRFDHKGGNEWWVEVQVGPVQPSVVWARDDGGQWVNLSLRDWGNWAGSFHIEPGHKVQFQAMFPGSGNLYTSCTFTHPAGLAPNGNQICENLESMPS